MSPLQSRCDYSAIAVPLHHNRSAFTKQSHRDCNGGKNGFCNVLYPNVLSHAVPSEPDTALFATHIWISCSVMAQKKSGHPVG